ncbi:G-protein alpha subunit-domain-containing protein [Jimgerdemannia flammicorona]|uniref:G-protein alpha subunit-domain-containing protein n=1 Tax=Jimgerdemannia flammicorona TaxID=994334 RepID=A0A433A2U6_9FUNG|nr:G-protein alpha subunit-domain-containing protein [Jimgerdemannia flammicorona]
MSAVNVPSGNIGRECSFPQLMIKKYLAFSHSPQFCHHPETSPYFDDCNAIIFMAAISSFDQTLSEDPTTNRMGDAITLFETICNNPLIKQTAMILFLNKIDVLKRKIEAGVLVKDYFRDYRGPNDFESITSFFQSLFFAQNKTPQKEIYVHLTHATDTRQMRVIVAAVNVIVQRMNLRNSGLFRLLEEHSKLHFTY